MSKVSKGLSEEMRKEMCSHHDAAMPYPTRMAGCRVVFAYRPRAASKVLSGSTSLGISDLSRRLPCSILKPQILVREILLQLSKSYEIYSCMHTGFVSMFSAASVW